MASEFHFRKGMEVEVFSDDKDLRGALFVATVIRSVSRKNKVLIEYQTLVADDEGTKPLRESVDVVYLRPIPPREADRSFNTSDEVDAYHNDGWWEGVVIRVLDNSRYLVYFRTGKEQLEFEQSEMRIHREWVRGVWVPPMEEELKPEVDVSHAQDRATQHNEVDGRNDQTQSSYVRETADTVKVELPSISPPLKKLKTEVSERSLVREFVPSFGKEETGGVSGYERAAGHLILNDLCLSPRYNFEEHCESSKSQVQCSQNSSVAHSKKLKKGDETGASVLMTRPVKGIATGAIPGPSDEPSAHFKVKEKISSALDNDGCGGHQMVDGLNLSPLYSIEVHREFSKARPQYPQNALVAQSCKKSKKGDGQGSSFSRGAIRIGSNFRSESGPTVGDFGLSSLLDIGQQSDPCAQVHCLQNNPIQY